MDRCKDASDEFFGLGLKLEIINLELKFLGASEAVKELDLVRKHGVKGFHNYFCFGFFYELGIDSTKM